MRFCRQKTAQKTPSLMTTVTAGICTVALSAASVGQTATTTISYTYDALNRLQQVSYGSASSLQFSYRYDVINNLIFVARKGAGSAVDSDGDGVYDWLDAFPNDVGVYLDLNGDGIGDKPASD